MTEEKKPVAFEAEVTKVAERFKLDKVKLNKAVREILAAPFVAEKAMEIAKKVQAEEVAQPAPPIPLKPSWGRLWKKKIRSGR